MVLENDRKNHWRNIVSENNFMGYDAKKELLNLKKWCLRENDN